jgi:hypothetical protein
VIARIAAFTVCVSCAAAAPLAAQTANTIDPSSASQARPAPPRPTGSRHELLIGGLISGPSSMGTADAQLLGSNGQTSLTLFSTKNGMSVGYGPELLLGFRAGRSTWVEVGGSVSWPSLQSKIDGDFEGADAQTVSARVTRWTVEGALVWWLKDQDRTGWFIRASGGVAGEVSGDLSSNATGVIGSGGAGVRHWFKIQKGGTRRMGVRAEFRGVVQSGGLSFDDRTFRFAPTGAVHLVFGY